MRNPLRSSRAWRSTVLLGLLVCAAAPSGAQSARPESEQRSALERRHLEATRARYAQAAWTVGAARSGLANELGLPGWVAEPLQSEAGLLTRGFRAASDEDGQPSFVLETCVEDTAAAAAERLLGWLAGLQSARTMPSTAEVGLYLGDAGFVGRSGAGPRSLAWIAFVRGNVAVRVSAFDATREPDFNLAAIAAAVDGAILRAPVLEIGARPAKPVIGSLSVPRASVVAGAALRLAVAVTDPAGGRPHLEWVVGGPGQGYVEQDANGDWLLHPTGPGRITLSLEVTGSTGTWTRHEVVSLSVLDD